MEKDKKTAKERDEKICMLNKIELNGEKRKENNRKLMRNERRDQPSARPLHTEHENKKIEEKKLHEPDY